MRTIKKALEGKDTRPRKGGDLTGPLMSIVVALAIYSPIALPDANQESEQIIKLYCEGKDWGSDRPKHISVSLDRAEKIISILDPLRDTPRFLRLIETPTIYKARGDYSEGYIDAGQEKITLDASYTEYCDNGELCDVYISYATEFKLNRQTGEFEYLVVEEVREESSDTLITTKNDWGIFRAARCRKIERLY
jgi:hypothetical protein